MRNVVILLVLTITFNVFCAAGSSPVPVNPESKIFNTAEVFFTENISADGVLKIYEKIKHEVKGKIGYKVHFGEPGNKNYIKPEMYRKLIDKYKGTFIETNVLYPSPRQQTKSHLKVAKDHGWTYAPVQILEEKGVIEVKIDGLRHFNTFYTGAGINDFDSIVVLSHFKGHSSSGFGGAIKNVSMGLGVKKGKAAMHAQAFPCVDSGKCINCGLCLKECAVDAITLDPVKIDPKKCIGCGKCIGACPVKVFSVAPNKEKHDIFIERLVEYTYALTRNRNMVYLNVIASISPHCDCMSRAGKPFCGDIGIAASLDPVALDAACLDLVNKECDCEDAFLKHSGVSGNHMFGYSEKIGLGTGKFRITNID